MNKVVYNACFGGFRLSQEAVILARELSGNPFWADIPLKGERYSDGENCTNFYGFLPCEFPRHDSVLVEVVEKLGEKAGGMCAELRVAKISGNMYRVDEYDGRESVVEPDGYDWIVIKEEEQ